MRRILVIIAGVLLMAAGWGCKEQSPQSRVLDRAEAIMETAPDSALTLLQAIDGASLTGEPQARHALLLTQARHKNYFDDNNDSLISIAVRYYSGTNEEHYIMLSYLYNSIINKNAGLYEDALLDALKSYEIALRRNDAENLSRIESVIARLYNVTYNFSESKAWDIQSLMHAKAAGKQQWVGNTFLNISQNFLNLQEFDKAITYADSASCFLGSNDFDVLETKYLSNYFLQQYTIADSIYSLCLEIGYRPSLRMATGHAELHQQNALEIIKNASETDSTQADFAYAMAYLRKGDIDSAIPYLQNHIVSHNNMISSNSQQILNKVKERYDEARIVRLEESARQSRQRTVLLGVITALAIAVLLLVIVQIRRNTHARELKKENDLLALRQEYERMKAEGDDNREALASLHRQSAMAFVERFSWVEKLGNMYIDAQISAKDRDKNLYAAISDALSPDNRQAFASEIETEIGKYSPALLDEINRCGLSPSQRETLLFLLAGFSPRIISLLTGRSPQSIYSLKHRLKAKIASPRIREMM